MASGRFIKTRQRKLWKRRGSRDDAVQAFGGWISARHGVGQMKREELQHRKPAAALQMMRSIKLALDPQGLMNPGHVV